MPFEIAGFLNAYLNQSSLLLAVAAPGVTLAGPGGSQIQFVETDGLGYGWQPTTVDFSSAGDWVIIGATCTATAEEERRRRDGVIPQITEQLTITITITPIGTNGSATGPAQSSTPTITAISDPALILIALKNPLSLLLEQTKTR